MFKRLLTTVLMAALLMVPALDADAGKRRADQFQADESFISVEQGSTPGNPAAGSHKLYTKSSDGRWYTLDSGGTERAVEQYLFCTITPDSGTNPVCDALSDTLSILGGAGIETTGDSGADSVTIATTFGSFETITGDSGTNPVATANTDTLTLSGGDGIDTSCASGTDTCTVSAHFATQGEAEAGTSTTDVMSPARSKDQFDYYNRYGFKNAVIDGDFDLWPTGTSFNDPNGVYTSALWVGFGGAANTTTYSRQAFTLGQTDVPGEPTYYMRIDKTAGTGAAPELHYRIEDVRTFAGQTVTLSFWAKADSARDMTGTVRQYFGSGGSPSSLVDYGLGTLNLTTSWQQFTVTVALTSISGKTLGTNGDDYLGIRLVWLANTNGTIDIAQVQLEKGSVATEFERRPLAVERELLKRYFRVVSHALALPISTTGVDFSIPHEGMRAAPSVSGSAALQITDSFSSNYTQSSFNAVIQDSDVNGSRVRSINFTGLTTGRPHMLYTAGGELWLDSRL